MAVLHARSTMRVGDSMIYESMIGTRFTGHIAGTTTVACRRLRTGRGSRGWPARCSIRPTPTRPAMCWPTPGGSAARRCSDGAARCDHRLWLLIGHRSSVRDRVLSTHCRTTVPRIRRPGSVVRQQSAASGLTLCAPTKARRSRHPRPARLGRTARMCALTSWSTRSARSRVGAIGYHWTPTVLSSLPGNPSRYHSMATRLGKGRHQ